MHFPHPRLPTTLLPANKSHTLSTNAPIQNENLSKPPKTIIKPSPCSQCESRTHTRSPSAQTAAQTRYIDMLLSLDSIPRSHNLFASFCTWILLAGFLIVPGTFTSMQKSKMIQEQAKQNAVANEVYEKIKHASLLWIAFSCCVIGSTGFVVVVVVVEEELCVVD